MAIAICDVLHRLARAKFLAMVTGGLWLVCMVVFEFTVGHYIFKFTWKWLLNDFNLFKGRLLLLGMVFLAAAPALVARCKGLILR